MVWGGAVGGLFGSRLILVGASERAEIARHRNHNTVCEWTTRQTHRNTKPAETANEQRDAGNMSFVFAKRGRLK